MTVLPALIVAVLFVLMLGVPAVVVYRDFRFGRPDPTFHDTDS